MRTKSFIVAAAILINAAACASTVPIYKDSTRTTDERVADLLGRMTLQEKTGQLLCLMGWDNYVRDSKCVRPSEIFFERLRSEMLPGSYWAVMRADPWTQKTPDNGLTPRLGAELLNTLQHEAIEKTRLGIPILFAEEAPHGHMALGTTVFPTGLSMASTWNAELLREAGEAVAMEIRSKGGHVGYGPVIDIARDPRWSRMEETFGEDPLLSARMGCAYMKGLQGDDISDGKHVASTLKHFAAYGVPEAGINGATAVCGTNRLFSDYIENFRQAVGNGAASIMTSYNTIDGVPSTSNRFLLDDVLRNQWKFKGIVFSDLFSIDGIIGSGCAPDLTEAAAMAIKAGVDLDLGGNAYRKIPEALEKGLITEADIDRAVARVLRLKFELGLFENPYTDPAVAEQSARTSQTRHLAREVARQGTVLLKNNGILPLSKNVKRVAVIGPNADNIYNQLGDYTAPRGDGEVATLLTGIREAAGPKTEVTYVKGCAVRDTTFNEIKRAVAAARAADVIILALGGSSARDFKTSYEKTGAAKESGDISDMECGEGFDRATLKLLGLQEQLLQALAATGKPLAVVYIAGRPLDMRLAAEKADALLMAWYPGGEGGRGIADIIFGDYNPSERLPVTVPRSESQIPIYYSQGKRRDYIDMPGTPLFAFGDGLSYTTFEYSGITMQPGEDDEIAQVSFTLTNTGEKEGTETAQLYISDPVASIAQAPLLLKDFRRIRLRPGESRNVTFPIKADHLAMTDASLRRVVELSRAGS